MVLIRDVSTIAIISKRWERARDARERCTRMGSINPPLVRPRPPSYSPRLLKTVSLFASLLLLPSLAASTGDALIEAAKRGDVQQARVLLDQGVRVDTLDSSRRTPLMWAALNGHSSLVDLLIDRGANVNAAAAHGDTVLGYAISCCEKPGSADIVTKLLDNGADPNAKPHDGWTPLMLAASRDRSEKLLNLLLTAGAEIDTQRPDGYTALMLAAARGLSAAVQTLLKRGADLTKKTRGGKTALNPCRGRSSPEPQSACLCPGKLRARRPTAEERRPLSTARSSDRGLPRIPAPQPLGLWR